MRAIERRIKKLETGFVNISKFFPVLAAVSAGKYYDEVDAELQTLYAEYWGLSCPALEEINTTVLGSNHVQMESLKAPPTVEELNGIIAEVQAMLLEADSD